MTVEESNKYKFFFFKKKKKLIFIAFLESLSTHAQCKSIIILDHNTSEKIVRSKWCISYTAI